MSWVREITRWVRAYFSWADAHDERWQNIGFGRLKSWARVRPVVGSAAQALLWATVMFGVFYGITRMLLTNLVAWSLAGSVVGICAWRRNRRFAPGTR